MKFPFTRRLVDPATTNPSAPPAPPVDLAAEFRCLWTTSQFFSVLQRLQLQPERGRAVDLSDLGRRLEEARQLRRSLAFSKLVALQLF